MRCSTGLRFRYRLIAIGVLAFWTAPGAGALAIGLHVTLGHHHGAHHPGDDHRAAAMDWAVAAVHGHRHDLEATPEHEHPAPVTGGASTLLSPSMPAHLPPTSAVGCLPDVSVESRSPARHGPPVSLFATHCSLLL